MTASFPAGPTLVLDASTYRASVAVLDAGAVRAETSTAMRDAHAERLMPAVDAALRAAGMRPTDLARVICGSGPGSFTSLRIAAGIAKGIALGLSVPLHGVSSLLLLVAGAPVGDGRYLAVLDALRGERYVAPVDVHTGRADLAGPPALLSAAEVAARAEREGRTRVGPAEPVAAEPRAGGVVRVLAHVLAAGPVALDAWQPEYGRLAEAQVKWEAAHGRPLPTG